MPNWKKPFAEIEIGKGRLVKDGNEIANKLFQKGIEEVISPDSLLIKASPRINFLINVDRRK